MLIKIYRKLKSHGLVWLINTTYLFIFPHRLTCFKQYKLLFKNKIGLEIGGPSNMFRRSGLIPVYAIATRIDNCNFSHQTIWEGDIKPGETFHYDKHRAPGTQYVGEATNLDHISSDSYDFVLSSHVIEHVANPLQALLEWTRVLKEKGVLMLVVPHKDGTFDHYRPVTSLEHLIEDFDSQVTEDDLTHLEEILSQHDLSMDPEAGDLELFKQRSKRNFENRCLHHHVFNTLSVIEMVNHMRLQILSVEVFKPFHIVVLAQKPTAYQELKNDRFRGINSPLSWISPFQSDYRHQ